MSRRSGFLPILAVLASLVVLVYVLTTVTIPGVSPTLGTNLLSILPGLLVTILGMFSFRETIGRVSAVGSAGVVGIGLAVLLSEMNTISMIDAAMYAPATLIQVQGVVFVASILIGAIFMGDR